MLITVMFINTLTVYELVKEFIKHAMEYEANHGVAVSLDIANKFYLTHHDQNYPSSVMIHHF